MKRRTQEAWAPWVAMGLIILAWQAVCSAFNVSEFIFPSPARIAEQLFEFRGEGYNVFNHPQYTPGFPGIANPSLTLASPSVTNMLIPSNSTFNRPDLAFASNARVLQFVARFQF